MIITGAARRKTEMALRCGIKLRSFAAVLLICTIGWSLPSHASVDWTYEYTDDFDTAKAETDSYDHSIFWPEMAFPPCEPHLYYSSRFGKPARALMFMAYEEQPAHLNYCFPTEQGPEYAVRSITGTMEFDVLFPSKSQVWSLGSYLLYSASQDGQSWTTPASLSAGHHSMAINSKQGTCYVAFSGSAVLFDNLQVHLNRPSRDIFVPEDFETIQEAINAASDGQIIEVAPGVYSGSGNRDIEFRGKAITLRSAAGPDVTVIDCGGLSGGNQYDGNSHRGFYIHEAETSETVLQGFTIQSGRIGGSEIPPDNMVWNLSPTHPVGGGIYCEFSGPSIINCRIINCRAEIGGGIGCVGASPVISDCVIMNCRAGGFGPAESGGRGGGIGLIRQCSARIINCNVKDNTGYYNSFGGGLYCRNSAARVVGCDISHNNASGNINGGGVYCSGLLADMMLQNCIISHNTAENGAGIFAEAERGIETTECIGVDCPRCRVTVANCTVAHNRISNPMPSSAAGGVYSNCGNITVKNSIVWYNDGSQMILIDPHSNSPVVFSDVQGGYPGSGNIDEQPLFAPTGIPDYHLQSLYGRYVPQSGQWVRDGEHSPCIDAGDSSDSVGQEPVPNGKRINMGAYGGTKEASKSYSYTVYHVDGSNGRNANSGFTEAAAFATIQKAIDTADDLDLILVWPGVYTEAIDYKGKAVTVQSASDAAVLQAPGDKAVSFYTAEQADSVLKNFVITNSNTGIFIEAGSPTISHVTVVGNDYGIAAWAGASPHISNSIFWNNKDGDLFGADAWFSFVEEFAPLGGDSDVDPDPLFADPYNGDYHLKSERGRYRPSTDEWILDDVTSPYIDAGDPSENPATERMPNGGRVNMGAYGRTAYASMSEWQITGDISRDGVVNMIDFVMLAEDWLHKAQWRD